MKKKLIYRCLLGAPIGVLVSLIITIIISLCTGNGEYFPAPHELMDFCGNTITAVCIQMVCSLLIGAIAGGSSVIWDVEQWSLLKQTLIHFIVISIPFFTVGYILNWLPHHLYGALGYAGAFILVYLIMWVSIYFSIKTKIKKMNSQLQELNQVEKE